MENIARSEQIGKLVGALAKAQLTFDPILKESENPAFKRGNKVSKYADMFSLVTATRKHLNANGLTVMQFPTVTAEGRNLIVTTMLAHESGEWISSEVLIPAVDERGFTAHSIGKAMTYARRYSWQSIIGAVAEDDDDGNDASGQGTREAAQAVGDAKVAELTGKAKRDKTPSNSAPSLFYVLTPSGYYEILGDEGHKSANRDLLKPFWQPNAKAILVNDEQLEGLKFHFEERHVPFSLLKEPAK